MKRLILMLLTVMLGFLVKAQQPAAVQRTNGSFTPIDPWLSVPKGINLTSILPTYNTEPDYEIDLVPDLQHMTLEHPDILDGMFQWFHDSAAYYNTKVIIQLGDITHWGTVSQFVTASNAFHHIDSTGIPYMAIIGNHDYDSMAFVSSNVNNRITNNYNAYFGPSRYASKPFYGGNYNGKNDNFYIKFDAGNTKMIAIALEFLPRDSSLAWAQRVLDSFPDRKAIIASHNYLSFYGEHSTDTTTYTTFEYGITGNAGQAMWDKLIKKNPQIMMVACGHQIHRVLYVPIVQRLTEAGLYGNVVNQILTNYQDDTNGGNGYFMRIKVKPSTGQAYIMMYSPTLKVIDTRFPPFTLGYPETRVNPVLGLSAKYGGLNVAGEARFDSSLFLTQLPLNHFVVTGKTGKLDTLAAQNPHKFLASNKLATDTCPYFRTIDTSDLPSGSSRYIQNLTPIAGASTGFQTANFWIKGTGVVGGPTGMFTTIGGTPGTFYVSHQSGNYGLIVQRAAGINTSGANMLFYQTYGNDFSSLAAVQPGAELGTIRWAGTTGTLTAGVGSSLRALTEVVGTNFISSGLDFRTTNNDNSSSDQTRMYLFGNGALRVVNLGASGNVMVGADNTGILSKITLGSNLSLNTGVLNTSSTVPTTSTGTAAPTSTPINIGDIYVDTVNKKLYFATGTSSSADWTIAN